MTDTYFVTGGQGCIGAWVVKILVERGNRAIVFDRSPDPHRLVAIIDSHAMTHVRYCPGDVTDSGSVLSAMQAAGCRSVIHLAGLMAPACQANPPLGASINVVGTVTVFDAAKKIGLDHIVYASSGSVLGLLEPPSALASDPSMVPSAVTMSTPTHYTAFKRANELTAQVYFRDSGLSSIGLRPFVVYGVGRDTGMTSDPTKAMEAAVRGQPFHIRFTGSAKYEYAGDTAAAFVACADNAPTGAHVMNLGGDLCDIRSLVALIDESLPRHARGLISFSGEPLAPPITGLTDSGLRSTIGPLPATPLSVGIRQTIEMFNRMRDPDRPAV